MIHSRLVVNTFIMTTLLSSCSFNQMSKNDNLEPAQSSTVGENQGKLVLVANGEDFVRQGFTSKDGWQIDFDHVYVNLNEVVAYQTTPPYNPDSEEEINNAQESVNLISTPTTVDLAAGSENAPPIEVTEVQAPLGNYNAIAWKIVNDQKDKGSIVLEGTATKDQEVVNFVLSFVDNLDYLCGEYVGDERKGIVNTNTSGELETTFHFDHIFGDIDTAQDDDLNMMALGFEPLAEISTDNQLQTNSEDLKQKLSSQDYQKLQKAIASLGHVGEGHCRLQKQP